MTRVEYTHQPVLLEECIQALCIRPDGIYVDGTLGRAGHSLEIAKRLTTGRLICIDRDMAAIDAAKIRLAPYLDRVTLVHSNFSSLADVLRQAGVEAADGMLFDLGVSSPQLDDASRGFSYMQDAPLDMRMDRDAALTAYEVVNTWGGDELRRILYEYGEERYAPAIARAIVRAREEKPVETTLELVDIIKGAMPPSALREKQHPAKRSFQAIRIAVNGELDELPPMLTSAVDNLRSGGRLAVIQLDDASRGFSYMQDAPLDMRMDRDAALTAYEVVNTWGGDELRRILYEYGEERYAPAIARAIVRAREEKPVETTLELVDIIKGAMPPSALREKQHPAKRSFQAIRIAVNGELDELPPMLTSAVDNLRSGGRLAVITFHSLEDRIVKRAMQDMARGCTCPPEFPVCVCGKKPRVRLVNRKPIVSGAKELEENPRARSAKLRVAEKCAGNEL